MTRKSKREIEAAVDDLAGDGPPLTVQEFLFQSTKHVYGYGPTPDPGRLSPAARDTLRGHLDPEADRQGEESR